MAFKFAPALGQAGSAAGGAGPLPGPLDSRPGVSPSEVQVFRRYLVREKGHQAITSPAAVWYEIAVKLSLHVRIDKEK